MTLNLIKSLEHKIKREATSIKIRPDIWKEAKIEAITGDVGLSELVEKVLEKEITGKVSHRGLLKDTTTTEDDKKREQIEEPKLDDINIKNLKRDIKSNSFFTMLTTGGLCSQMM
jgi:hypothetical protein